MPKIIFIKTNMGEEIKKSTNEKISKLRKDLENEFPNLIDEFKIGARFKFEKHEPNLIFFIESMRLNFKLTVRTNTTNVDEAYLEGINAIESELKETIKKRLA